MARRLAVKRLTASDLTLFKWHYEHRAAGHQKAINLNANVFVSEMFPSLPEVAEAEGGRLSLDLDIFGPGTAGLLNLQRKIIKGDSYKNWRLDGEFIANPIEDGGRFNPLAPGDFVVFDFEGAVVPKSARAVFIARAVADDADLHAALGRFLGSASMKSASARDLESVVSAASIDYKHPIHELLLGSALEDVALGGSEGIRTLTRRESGATMSRVELLRARASAEAAGERGEEFVNVYLLRERSHGRLTSSEWVSRKNAVAPYDFTVRQRDDIVELVDVKSTTGEFERSVHVSRAELETMAADSRPYRVYRVYEMDERHCMLRVSSPLNLWAQGVLDAMKAVPSGVSVDSVSVLVTSIAFGPPIAVSLPDDSDGEWDRM